MANIVLTGDTSGAITVAAPAVAGTNTLTLPANTGTLMTSTYTSGDVDIDSGTLHVNATNNRVGIGISNPSEKLHVGGSGSTYARISSTNAGSGAGLWFQNATSTYLIGAGPVSGGSELAFYDATNTTERMRIQSDGNVLIGTTSFISGTAGVAITPTNINISNSGTGGDSRMTFHNGNGQVGQIYTNASSTTFSTSSDYRLKEKVSPMSGSIDRLKQLKPSTWAWIQDGSHGEGFLAHEAQTIVPECAIGTKDAMKTEKYEVTPAVEATYDEEDNELTPAVEAVIGTREVPDYQGIDQSKLVPLLTSALQEAIQRIEALENA